MILVSCPNCGTELHIADRFRGQKGRCQYCGQYINVPGPPAPARGASSDETSQPVGPEHFGHYKKAPDEDWEDPYAAAQGEVALGDIPEEVLAKHRAFLERKRKRVMLLALSGALLAAAVVVVVILVFGLLRTGEKPSGASTTAPQPTAGSPVRPPGVATEPAPAPATPAKPATVFSVRSDPHHYHRKDCPVYLAGIGERYVGTVAQASAAGYRIPCSVCRPDAIEVSTPGDAAPLPFPVPPDTSPPGPAEKPSVVYVTPTGDLYHAHGCPLLQGASNPVSLDDALSRGYKPCARCIGHSQ